MYLGMLDKFVESEEIKPLKQSLKYTTITTKKLLIAVVDMNGSSYLSSRNEMYFFNNIQYFCICWHFTYVVHCFSSECISYYFPVEVK